MKKLLSIVGLAAVLLTGCSSKAEPNVTPQEFYTTVMDTFVATQYVYSGDSLYRDERFFYDGVTLISIEGAEGIGDIEISDISEADKEWYEDMTNIEGNLYTNESRHTYSDEVNYYIYTINNMAIVWEDDDPSAVLNAVKDWDYVLPDYKDSMWDGFEDWANDVNYEYRQERAEQRRLNTGQ